MKLTKISAEALQLTLSKQQNFETEVKQKVAELITRLPRPEQIISLPVTIGDGVEEQVQKAVRQIKTALDNNTEQRMQFTRLFDSIKSQFTTSEKEVKNNISKLEQFISDWRAEKVRRVRAEEEKKRKEYELKMARNAFKDKVISHYSHIIFQIGSTISKHNEESFYAQNTEEDLKNFVDKLKADNKEGYTNAILKSLKPNNINPETDWQAEILTELTPTIQALLPAEVEKMLERDTELISRFQNRVAQLKILSKEDKEAEEKALQERLLREHKEEEELRIKELEEATRKARIEELANQEEEVQVATELSKGTRINPLYKINSHSDITKIIAFYVEEEMHNIDLETIKKRLSFMLTFANRELKKGNEIDGIEIIEEIK